MKERKQIHPDVQRTMDLWDARTGLRSKKEDEWNAKGPQSRRHRTKIGQAQRIGESIQPESEPEPEVGSVVASRPLTEKEIKWLTDLIENPSEQQKK